MWLSVSFRSEPILDIETFRFRIVMTSIEQLRWIDGTILRNDLGGAGVQNPQPSLQFSIVIGLDQVRFGDEWTIGHCGLLDRLDLLVERVLTTTGIDCRDHAVETVAPRDSRVAHQRMKDRRRVGETNSLNHHAVKP